MKQMKNLLKRFYIYLFYKGTRVLRNSIKTSIQVFFDGSLYSLPEAGLPSINQLGITNLKLLRATASHIDYQITTQRPGSLIGKNGEIIKRLEEHISIMQDGISVKIHVIESRLWRHEYESLDV